MTSPSDMDKPAMILTAVIGLVLIGVSLPFLILDGGAGGQRYNIGWTEVEVAEDSRPFGAPGTPVTFTVTTPSAIVSNVTVGITCDDTPGTPARPATISWTLREGSRTLATGSSVACEDDAELDRVNITAQPDVGAVTADSASDAEGEAYDAGENQTRSFTLEFSYSRPAATVPSQIPVGQPTIAGRMTLTALAWQATANQPEEASR